MKVNQVYEVLNEISAQAFGEKAISVVDATGFVSLGEYVVGNDTAHDNFFKTMADKYAKLIIDSRKYTADDLAVVLEPFEFGAIMQKLHVDMVDAVLSPTWDLQNGQSVDQYQITKQTVKQKLFSDMNTWQVEGTIPEVQTKTAFESPEQMAAFIDALYLALLNSMELQLERMIATCYTNFIGEKISHYKTNGGLGVVNLLQSYNTKKGTTLKAEVALMDADFLKFCGKEMNLYIKRMKKLNTLFNDVGYKRFTPQDETRVTLLADFVENAKFYMQSDVFNLELVQLPLYGEIVYWQGTGTDYTYASTSQINMKTASGATVVQNGIIGLITDRNAIGSTIKNRRSRSAMNVNGEYINHFEKAEMGYFNDMSEQGIVFIVSDTPPTYTPPAPAPASK